MRFLPAMLQIVLVFNLEGINLKILHLATLRGRLLRKETTAEDNISRKFSLFFNSPDLLLLWKLNSTSSFSVHEMHPLLCASVSWMPHMTEICMHRKKDDLNVCQCRSCGEKFLKLMIKYSVVLYFVAKSSTHLNVVIGQNIARYKQLLSAVLQLSFWENQSGI